MPRAAPQISPVKRKMPQTDSLPPWAFATFCKGLQPIVEGITSPCEDRGRVFGGHASPSGRFRPVFTLLYPPVTLRRTYQLRFAHGFLYDFAKPETRLCKKPLFLFHAWFSCRFKSFLKYCLKTGFQRVFTSVSTFPHFPRYCGARSGERGSPDGRSPSWPTRTACIAPAAPSASRRRSSAPAPAAGPCVSRRITVHRDNAEADALRRAAQTRDNVCAPLPAVHTDHIARKL